MAKKAIKNLPKKRGVKPKGKVKIKWSSDFAYAVGLIATDGCVYNNGRHISLTSLDIEQLIHFNKALGIDVKISKKHGVKGITCTHIQFSDVLFHQFLISIGITPAKSKTIGVIDIPKKYFFDFLRGCFDGDGSFYSYYDKRWRSSFMFYLTLASASPLFLSWVRNELKERISVEGHISKAKETSTHQLRYAKKESMEIIKKIYYNEKVLCLTRKRKKIEKALNNKDS